MRVRGGKGLRGVVVASAVALAPTAAAPGSLAVALAAATTVAALQTSAGPAHAQAAPRNAADSVTPALTITAQQATTWSNDKTSVVQLQGPLTIDLDQMRLTADRAVIWLTPTDAKDPERRTAQIALIGDARAEQPEAVRSGQWLLVDVPVHGAVRITAEAREERDASDSPLYREAVALRQTPRMDAPLRPGEGPARSIRGPESVRDDADVAPPATTTAPATDGGRIVRAADRVAPVNLVGEFDNLQTARTADGKLAIVLSEGFMLSQDAPGGLLQLQAKRGVIFTTLEYLGDADAFRRLRDISEAVTAAYLEGDVIVTFTPSEGGIRAAEQRLEANRVYYDFTTDRAVLTQAVLHQTQSDLGMPVFMRAETIRQLARTERITEFGADKATLTTSGFAVPSLSVGTSKVYVKQTDTGDPRLGTRTTFAATNATFRSFGVPFFYLPAVGGTMTENGFPLRGVGVGNSKNFGLSLETRWGLFETLGILPPEDLDVALSLDYYQDRGPAAGLDAKYGGGFITDTTRQPWNFTGEFTSYFAHDSGVDNLGRDRGRIAHEDELRGRASWEHQHFFPDHWQAQFRANYVSDETFLEEWFEREFDTELPQETSAYFKRQEDTEALTLLVTVQPNDVITTSDLQQEQFEIERLPEISYHRIGDSFWNDRLTFFSNNTVSSLRFNTDGAQDFRPGWVKNDQGFRSRRGNREPALPGRPSLGLPNKSGFDAESGIELPPDDWNQRGDFRQEVAAPFNVGQVKVMPYVVGRLTAYSDNVFGENDERFYAGTGVRFNTAFWRVFDEPYSKLFDIDRLRHIVEPEVHLYTSAQTTDRDDLFWYDEPIDAINDVSAAQVALRQRWQTKRGAPDRRRSVDVFALNVEGNFFANEPVDSVNEDRDPFVDTNNFRGVFFPSLPEASIPRDSLNVDAAWRVTDTTILLAGVEHNLSEMELATAAAGLAVDRGDRLSYFLGMRYIEEVESAIGSLAFNYELTRKYALQATQSYDFGSDDGQVYSSVGVRRRFDRFFMVVSFYHNARDDESGFRFNLYPQGLGGVGLGTETMTPGNR